MSAQIKFRLKTKRCRCCGETKPDDEFYVDQRYRDGRSSWCISCVKARSAQTARERGNYQSQQRAKWAEIARQNAAERDA